MENPPYQGQAMSLNAHNGPDVKTYTSSQIDALHKEIDHNQRRNKEVIQEYAKQRQEDVDERLGGFAQKVIQTPFRELEQRQENGNAPTKVLPLNANRKVNIPLDEIQNGIFIGQKLNDRKLPANESDTIRRASLALDVKNSKGGALTNAEGCGLYIEPSSDRSRFDITNPFGNNDMVIWVGEKRERILIKADGKVKQIDMTNKSGIVFVMGGENGNKAITIKNHLRKNNGSITVQSKHLEGEKVKDKTIESPKKKPQPETNMKRVIDGNMGQPLDGGPKNPWALFQEAGFDPKIPVIYGGEPKSPSGKERFAVAIAKIEDGKGYPIVDSNGRLVHSPELVQFKIVNGKLEYTCISEKQIIPITHRKFSKMDILSAPLVNGQIGQIEPNSQGEFTVDGIKFIIKTGNINNNPPEISIEVKSEVKSEVMRF